MKPDCLIIVDQKNDPIWLRSPTYSLELAAQALKEFRLLKPNEPLTLIRSFADKDGKEQHIEIINPWADAYLAWRDDSNRTLAYPAKAAVELWHEKVPMFGMGGAKATLDQAEFQRVADFIVAEPVATKAGTKGEICESRLDQVFAASQNIDCGWRPGRGCRSTSVGDVLVLKTASDDSVPNVAAYVTSSFGFTPVQFLNYQITEKELTADKLAESAGKLHSDFLAKHASYFEFVDRVNPETGLKYIKNRPDLDRESSRLHFAAAAANKVALDAEHASRKAQRAEASNRDGVAAAPVEMDRERG